MAEYRELNPTSTLQADVACVWFDDRVRPATDRREQLVVPDGCVDIVWVRGRPPSVAGPATVPVTVPLPPDAVLLGLRFKPGSAPAFLNAPADALLNADVPLRSLWGDAAERLWDELEATPSIAQGLAALQRAVEAQRQVDSDSLVAEAVAQLRREPEVRVRDLGDRFGISERQLLRRFSNAVGYGPKVLARVLRFQHFMQLLYAPRTQSWDLTRMAVECGYADHAHLTRECSDLAGRPPSVLRAS